MPRWQVQGPSGQTFEVEGDREPTEAELAQVMASIAAPEQDPTLGAEAEDPRIKLPEGDVNSQVMSPAFQAIREAGMDRGAAEAAPVIGTTLATAGLAGLTGGAGVLPAAARAALSPAGSGVIATGTALGHGASLPAAIGAGVTAAATDKVLGVTGKIAGKVLGATFKPAVGAQMKHAVVRGVKTVAEQAAREAGLSAKEVSRLATEHAEQAGQRANKEVLQEAHDYIIKSIKSKTFDSRAKMADALKIKFGTQFELSQSSARKLVDVVLDNAGLGPKPTAAEMGVSLNERIRAAQAAQAAKGGS